MQRARGCWHLAGERPIFLRMDVSVFPSADLAAIEVARRIAQALAAKPVLVLALPTGRTPLPVYRELIRLQREQRFTLGGARTFNLDEFVGLNGADAGSFRAYMERHLFGPLGFTRADFLDGRAKHLQAECARYDRAIRDAGGIDLALLGVGQNGHLAFNEPANVLMEPTHIARLTRQTRLANIEWFGGQPDAVPLEALTMGLGAIRSARRITLLATGATKAAAVRALRAGPMTPQIPATMLRDHPALELVLDAAASG